MIFDQKGRRLSSRVFSASIRSRARLTYTEVWSFLGPSKARHPNPKIDPMLREAFELFEILENLRYQRGSLQLDIPELEFDVNSQGDVQRAYFAERNPAHKLIECFMVAANEAVAEFLEQRDLPCLYRIHERPDPLKIEKLVRVLDQFGVDAQIPSNPKPKDLQKLIGQFSDHEESGFLHGLVLRSMKQAQYSPANKGHFGLASEAYCHFTSPIRRYPDLFVHRVLRESEFGKFEVRARASWLEELAEDCNITERRATLADREMADIKQTRWLESRIGKDFEARVISVKDFGLFVRLEESPIEGLIKLESLPPDFWQVNELETELRGRRSKKSIRLGDRVLVKAVGVDRIKRLRDFRYLKPLARRS
jgi:ribonuclease R